MSAPGRTDPGLNQAWSDFHSLANMSAAQLRDWLASAPDIPGDFRIDPGTDEPVDLLELGWQLVTAMGKRKTDATDADVAAMRRAASIIRAHLANRPASGAQDDDWRHALMLIGHDPLRSA